MALRPITTLTRVQTRRLERVDQALLDRDLWSSVYGIDSTGRLVGEIRCSEGYQTDDLYAVTAYVFGDLRKYRRTPERIVGSYAEERDLSYGL